MAEKETKKSKPELVKKEKTIKEEIKKETKTKPDIKQIPKAEHQTSKPEDKANSSFDVLFFVMVLVIVVLVIFIQLSMKARVYDLNISGYKVKVSFARDSPSFYIILALIITSIVALLRSMMHAKKPKEKEVEKEKQAKIEVRAEKKAKPEKEREKQAKEPDKMAAKKKPNPGLFYSILFLVSIVLFFVALTLKNNPTMLLALALMFLSLFGYKQLRKQGAIPTQAAKGAKELKPSPFSSIKERFSSSKQPVRLPKIPLGKYETHFDVLYKVVEQKGRVRLPVLAKYFGVDKKKVEEWATILEEHKLLTLHYPAIGDPEVVKRVEEQIDTAKAEVKGEIKLQPTPIKEKTIPTKPTPIKEETIPTKPTKSLKPSKPVKKTKSTKQNKRKKPAKKSKPKSKKVKS